jgi:hypothetical protein
MSSGNVLVNDTVRIKVKFIDTDPITGEQENVSPISVFVNITNASGQSVVNTSATSLNSSEYFYDFTPATVGQFNVVFTGVLEDSSQIIVNQNLYVSDPDGEYMPSVTLSADETIMFAPDITPLYIDPEEILLIFPEATLIESGELVHHYSNEVKQIFSLKEEDTGEDLSFTVYEYIKASVACELSRTYGFGGDDELQVRLGDLSITNKSIPRGNVNRGNATTWCQIAAALRKEMIAKTVGIKGVQPKGLPTFYTPTTGKSIDPETGLAIYLRDRDLLGPGRKNTNVDDPMPKRGLRSRD